MRKDAKALRQLLREQRHVDPQRAEVTLVAIQRGQRRHHLHVAGEDLYDVNADGLDVLRAGEPGDTLHIPWDAVLQLRVGDCVLWDRYGDPVPRGRIVLVCSTCTAVLTGALEEATDALSMADGQPAVARGAYHGTAPGTFGVHAGKLLTDLDDVLLSPGAPARRRGCCGCAGQDGPNLVCACGRSVATEVSDCLTPHYVAFEPGLTRFRPVLVGAGG